MKAVVNEYVIECGFCNFNRCYRNRPAV